MLSSTALLMIAAQVSAPAPADLLDFSGDPRSEATLQLIGPEGHSLVPEGEGPGRWTFDAGVLTASPVWDSVVTPETYGDFRMHLEFAVNRSDDENPEARGNSGVYIQQRYELQIHDSFATPLGRVRTLAVRQPLPPEEAGPAGVLAGRGLADLRHPVPRRALRG